MHAVEKDTAVFHLPGHPLPALTSLLSTDAEQPKVDLFMVSLSRPVLLCAFSFPTRATEHGEEVDCAPTQPSGQQLLAFKSHLAELRKWEPQLLVYGLSTYSPPCQSRIHAALGLPFPLLSDPTREFCDKLELPTYEEGGVRLLRRCTLLLREGQVTRIDYPLSDPAQAAVRAEYMFQRDAGHD
ncbi:hypothetical protein MOBT1_001469 [Malassezia obtusa]|uniref:Alkyl hydroperoxide reductase subunit C/ Thiol specific antioxidant domain-containing protein n=1 Tax=Malassezia obtusa TaxID=76774 RepID=A0AAF0DZF1_9BASI|nr:hypothetical protein MOBT1_001469 [Malassezia obtusa]